VKLYDWTVLSAGPQGWGRTFWFLDTEELGDVDRLGISSGDNDGKVGAGDTTVVGFGTIDWSLNFYPNIECF
jgi:hypothetical protein